MFKYFSKSTLNDERYNWVRYVTALVMFFPVVIAVALDLMGRSPKVPMIIFMVVFFSFCLIWIVTWYYHNYRIKRDERNDNNLDT